MPSTTEHTGKPRLTRKILAAEKVFFDAKVHRREDLPEWLRPMCHDIRWARTKVPKSNRKIFEREIEDFECEGQDGETAQDSRWSLKPRAYMSRKSLRRGEISPAETEINNALDDCMKVKEQAIELREGNVPEGPWTSLLKTEFFKTYREVHPIKDERKDLYNRWELHQNHLWNDCPSKRALTSPVRTEPKPDFAYLFPIIDPASKVARRLHFDPRIKNFTLPVLSELRKTGGVISSPTTALSNCDPTKLDNMGALDLVCFPWAIVEVKHGTGRADKAEFCYCQAANGSAEALIMREKLAEKVDSPNTDALVIFSFTCVGPSVRLWLTFRHPQSRQIQMRCIWATSLELTWGVFALRMVIDNVREWAFNQVKPKICEWISYVRSNPMSQTFLDLDGNQVERRRRAKSLEPDDERAPVRASLPERPASHSKLTSAYVRENTVSRHERSPSPLARRSAPPMSPSDDDDEEEEEEDEEEEILVLEAYDSGDDEDYVLSDNASGDDDGYTTVEEESYDTSEDEDEPDEGYLKDTAYKALNEAEFLLKLRGRKSICC